MWAIPPAFIPIFIETGQVITVHLGEIDASYNTCIENMKFIIFRVVLDLTKCQKVTQYQNGKKIPLPYVDYLYCCSQAIPILGQQQFMFKYTPNNLEETGVIAGEAGYIIRYEKGRFCFQVTAS